MTRRLGSTGPGSCRQCAVACDRVVYPAGCVQAECPELHMDVHGGRVWMGCLAGVFAPRIDVARFRRMQRTAMGFGALRIAREPLPVCRCEVQRTFAHRGGPCLNPDFLLADAPGGYRVTNVAGGDG